jgi:hypothetical protein
MIPVAWFLPEVAIFSSQQPSTGTFTASLASTDNQPLLHWSLTPPATADPDQAALLSRVGSYDLELGLATALPSALSYTVHPDDNVGIDIPVTILYSDYRTVDGVAIPFRVQRYFNGTLSLDITLNNAVVAH